MKIKKETILRTICLAIALVNEVLAVFGKDKLPFTENELYQAMSMVLTLVTALVAWWKNNSFTPAAIAADKVLDEWKVTEDDDDLYY